ncbi:MAG: hypothetical protein KF693_05155 [Nitrospira sp.]|nr:hypothetical protein [Nitrospira sp.]
MSNVSEPSEAKAKKELHRAKMKQWHITHPNYQREHKARQKQLQTELGCSLNGSLPLKLADGSPSIKRIKGKLPYSIHVTHPLQPEEKVVRANHHTTKEEPR